MFQNQQAGGGDEISLHEAKYKSARLNLLIIIACTAINIVLISLGTDTFFLFSAFVPYLLILYGNLLCGKLPPEYYEGEDMSTLNFLPDSFFWGMVATASVILLLYLLTWFFAKNEEGNWLLFGLVLYALDFIVMLIIFGFQLSMIVDYIIHGLGIGILASGVIAGIKRRKILRAMRASASRPQQVESPYPEEE